MWMSIKLLLRGIFSWNNAIIPLWWQSIKGYSTMTSRQRVISPVNNTIIPPWCQSMKGYSTMTSRQRVISR